MEAQELKIICPHVKEVDDVTNDFPITPIIKHLLNMDNISIEEQLNIINNLIGHNVKTKPGIFIFTIREEKPVEYKVLGYCRHCTDSDPVKIGVHIRIADDSSSAICFSIEEFFKRFDVIDAYNDLYNDNKYAK